MHARLKLSVHGFYPGSVDAETVIAFIRDHLRQAQLEGRPYTRVLFDGVHNALVQFPLLEREPLFWPTLYRLLRTEGLNTVSTLSFFHPTQTDSEGIPEIVDATSLQHFRSGRFLFHSCISGCDYAFRVENPSPSTCAADKTSKGGIGKDWVLVHLEMTVDLYPTVPPNFWWDLGEYRYRHSVSLAEK